MLNIVDTLFVLAEALCSRYLMRLNNFVLIFAPPFFADIHYHKMHFDYNFEEIDLLLKFIHW